MALSDPFQTTFEGARQGLSTFGESLQILTQQYVKNKKEQREKQERIQRLKEIGVIEEEQPTLEDYKKLAKTQGATLNVSSKMSEDEALSNARMLTDAFGLTSPKTGRWKINLDKIRQHPGLDVNLGTAEATYKTSSGIGKDVADVFGLTSEQQLQGRALARKVYGRDAKYGLPAVYEEMRKGKSINTIKDSLRYAGQSPEFSGSIRNAAQQIMAGKASHIKQSTFDDLDDLENDAERQKSYLKRIAVNLSPVEIQNKITGKERTVELLDEIKGDLDILEKNGIDTNILSGTYEEVQGKLGEVANPQLRQLITKINTAIYNYRKDMSGVAFPDKETRDYKRIFPGGGKTKELNMANINGLKNVFSGDVEYFYKRSMGSDNYNKLFGEEPQSTQTQAQDMVKIRNKKTGEMKLVPKDEVSKYAE